MCTTDLSRPLRPGFINWNARLSGAIRILHGISGKYAHASMIACSLIQAHEKADLELPCWLVAGKCMVCFKSCRQLKMYLAFEAPMM